MDFQKGVLIKCFFHCWTANVVLSHNKKIHVNDNTTLIGLKTIRNYPNEHGNLVPVTFVGVFIIEHKLLVSSLLSHIRAMSKESLTLNTLWKYLLKRLACSAGMLVVQLLYVTEWEILPGFFILWKDQNRFGLSLSEALTSKRKSTRFLLMSDEL